MSYHNAELGLLAKLRSLDPNFSPPTGLTTPEQRRDAVRAAIMPWLDVTYTIRNGKRITMAMQYADVFDGEVLVAPSDNCEHGIPRRFCTGVHE
jgi:hypothetical protein